LQGLAETPEKLPEKPPEETTTTTTTHEELYKKYAMMFSNAAVSAGTLINK